jgi:hypothetical protein
VELASGAVGVPAPTPVSRMHRTLPRPRRAHVALILAALVSGCSLTGDGRDGTFSGMVEFGFEQSAFEPCNSDEIWWIDGGTEAGTLSEQYFQLQQQGATPVFARVEGETTERGTYGHVGAYDRELRVDAIVDVRAGECPR